MTHVTVELFANNDFDAPIGPINVAVQELFPLILSTKRFPVSVENIDLATVVNTGDELKGVDLSVIVSIEYGRNLAKKIQKINQQLVAALKQVLGEGVEFQVDFYFVTFTHASVVKSTKKKLPILEKDPVLTEALERIFNRIILEDERIEVDADTGAIRILAELDADLPAASSVLGAAADDESETQPSGLVSLGAGEPVIADKLPAPKRAVAL
ncbi:MAG: hypothetical protein WAO28_04275 [Candidatus Microsaccharimonas sp.]